MAVPLCQGLTLDLYSNNQKFLLKDLKNKSNQGEIYYLAPGAKTGPAYNPTIGDSTEYRVYGTSTGVSEKYLKDSSIKATDKLLRIGAFAVDVSASGRLKIDGTIHQIVRVDRIPASGTLVAWRVFARK